MTAPERDQHRITTTGPPLMTRSTKTDRGGQKERTARRKKAAAPMQQNAPAAHSAASTKLQGLENAPSRKRGPQGEKTPQPTKKRRQQHKHYQARQQLLNDANRMPPPQPYGHWLSPCTSACNVVAGGVPYQTRPAWLGWQGCQWSSPTAREN